MDTVINAIAAATIAFTIAAVGGTPNYSVAITDGISAEDDCPYSVTLNGIKMPLRSYGPVCLY